MNRTDKYEALLKIMEHMDKMEQVSCYIGEVFNIYDYTAQWNEDAIRERRPETVILHGEQRVLQVEFNCTCRQVTTRMTRLFLEDEWNKAKESGYYVELMPKKEEDKKSNVIPFRRPIR